MTPVQRDMCACKTIKYGGRLDDSEFLSLIGPWRIYVLNTPRSVN